MSERAADQWEKIVGRIDEVRLAIERGFVPTAAEKQELLRTRAQELSREAAREPVGDAIEVVEFELADEHYGFELTRVREACLLREVTPVPCTPSFVLGIINLRGEIRTVINLKEFFGLPGKGITQLNKIILIQDGDMQLGILADEIRGVRSILLGDLQPVLPTLTGVRADYFRGVTSDRLIVLDAVKILADERIVIQEEVEL